MYRYMFLRTSILVMALSLVVQVDAQKSTGNNTIDSMMVNETIPMNETINMSDTMYESIATASSADETIEELKETEEIIAEDLIPNTPEPISYSTAEFTISIPPPTSSEPTTSSPSSQPTTPPPSPAPTIEPTGPTIRNCFDSPVRDNEIQEIRREIENFILDNGDINYPAKFVRLGFHHCVGGCNGCVSLPKKKMHISPSCTGR